jgi:hypothetical protein
MGSVVRRTCGALPLIAAAIVAAALFAPAPANGECGDYIVYGKSAHGQPIQERGPAPVGCKGANCSQSPPPAPMPQAPPTLRILPDQSLPLTRGESDSSPDSTFFSANAADGMPVHRPSDVFHPPR